MEIDIKELDHDFPFEIGNDLKFIEIIDKGAFGIVLRVLDKQTNEEIAVKVINKIGKSHDYIEKKKKEIIILRKLNHPNIVKFYGFMETNNQLLIKMEYIKYGTLKHWINNKENISEEDASTIIRKILSAVEYLHSKQICHRDIKPGNIMISKKNDLNSIKIVDFGLSKENFNNLLNNDYSGTYIYMAPELIEKKLYFLSVDIWSIGILMFILLNKGKHPFYIKGDNNREIAEKIKKGKIKFYENISPMAKHLILKLLEPNPSWRYTASQALKHPWITRNFNDTPPQTFNEILLKSNNKKILKDLLYTCLFLNYYRNNRDLKINNKKEMKKEYKNVNIIENNANNNLFQLKLIDKSYSILTRNPSILSTVNQKYNILMDSSGHKNQNISISRKSFSILQNYKFNKSKNFGGITNRNSVFVKLSKSNFTKNNSYKNIMEHTKNNSFKNIKEQPKINISNMTITCSPIKNKITNNIDVKFESSIKKKKKEFQSDKMILQRPKNLYQYLSSKKLIHKLPKIIKEKKFNLSKKISNSVISLNNIENSNLIPFILPNIGSISKRVGIYERKSSFKNMQILKK